MSDLFTRSRTVILRQWRELEPKLAVGLLTGSITGFALDFAAQNNIHLSATAQHFIVIAGFFVGGYIKSSSFPTIQQISDDLPKAEAVAEHIIHPPLASAASPATSPVKVVPSAAKVSLSDLASAPTTSAPTAVAPVPPPVPEDDKATQVLPGTAAAFMGNRFGA